MNYLSWMLGRGVGGPGGAAGLADLEEGWRRVRRKLCRTSSLKAEDSCVILQYFLKLPSV
jgi:hypothetical protein